MNTLQCKKDKMNGIINGVIYLTIHYFFLKNGYIQILSKILKIKMY